MAGLPDVIGQVVGRALVGAVDSKIREERIERRTEKLFEAADMDRSAIRDFIAKIKSLNSSEYATLLNAGGNTDVKPLARAIAETVNQVQDRLLSLPKRPDGLMQQFFDFQKAIGLALISVEVYNSAEDSDTSMLLRGTSRLTPDEVRELGFD